MTSAASTNTGGIGTGNPASVSASGALQTKEAQPTGRASPGVYCLVGRTRLGHCRCVRPGIRTVRRLALRRAGTGEVRRLRVLRCFAVGAGLCDVDRVAWAAAGRLRCRRCEFDGQAGEVDLQRTEGVGVVQLDTSQRLARVRGEDRDG